MVDEKRCIELFTIDELVALSIKENCRRVRSEIIKFSALQKSQRQEEQKNEQRKKPTADK